MADLAPTGPEIDTTPSRTDAASRRGSAPPTRCGGVDVPLEDHQAGAVLAQLAGEREQVLQ
jgi:hypothetical protein